MDLWNAVGGMPVLLIVAIAIILVLVTVYMAYEHAKLKGLDGIRAEVYQLMLKAEHDYIQSGAGRQKLKYVVSRARSLLPGWLQFFISDDFLMDLIDSWFREVKDLLDDGKINESQNPEELQTEDTF